MEKSAVWLSNVTKNFGGFTAVDAMDLSIGDGEFFSLLGPSGCGKTTTLRMIAGFEQPTEGEIYIMGQAVAGIPAYRRPVNTVFQSYALFPHMTVRQNVAFGLTMSKVPKSDIDSRVKTALARVRMEDFAERKPNQLSGGQRQRIALARALVNRPKVLLLDEPLGALDLKLRKAMQLELKHIQSEVGITFIYVTHDQEEALTMSDRIAVMDRGLVQQVGHPKEIYEQPHNRFVADFIGETNFINGSITSAGKTVELEVAGMAIRGRTDLPTRVGQAATMAIRPEKMSLFPGNGAGSPAPEERDENENWVSGRVAEVIYIGTDTRYRVALLDGQEVFVRVQNLGTAADPTFLQNDPVLVHWTTANGRVLTE